MKKETGKMTLLDRAFSVFGVPAASNRGKAVADVDRALRVSKETNNRAAELIDAMRKLDRTLG